MTYLRSYVNNMLKNHPYGDTFEEIRGLARYVEDYVTPIPDPEEEDQTKAQKILDSILKIVGLSIVSLVVGGSVRINRRSDIRRENLPKYYEKLNQNLSDLMDVLDCSKDSIWLATYMVEEGAPGCPLAVNVFKKYLEKCKLNPKQNPHQKPSVP